MHEAPVLDALIVGAGPGGLTTAIYLKRFRRDIAILDGGQSRAAWIPTTRNHPGFPDGIAGRDLLSHLRAQLAVHGGEVVREVVAGLHRGETFRAVTASGREIRARHVVLATGVVDIEPPFPEAQEAMRSGHVRQCPVCDGFEAIDKRVVVIGHTRRALAEALFLRAYTADIAIATLGADFHLAPEDEARRAAAGIAVIETPLARVGFEAGEIARLSFADGGEIAAQGIYSALGIEPRTELAAGLGLAMDKEKRVLVNARQHASVPGAYAVGDIVTGLNQLGVAMAQGEIAAVDIHNALRRAEGLSLE